MTRTSPDAGRASVARSARSGKTTESRTLKPPRALRHAADCNAGKGRGRPRGRQVQDAALTPFARALYDARMSLGLSQFELGARLGLSHGAIGNAETARASRPGATLSVEHVRTIAAMLGTDPDPLLAARALSCISWRLVNLSPDHAAVATALQQAWPRLSPNTLRAIRALIGGVR